MSKIVKGIGRGLKKIGKGLKKVFKKVTSSKFFKVALAAVAIYTGFQAIQGMMQAGAGAGGVSGAGAGGVSGAGGTLAQGVTQDLALAGGQELAKEGAKKGLMGIGEEALFEKTLAHGLEKTVGQKILGGAVSAAKGAGKFLKTPTGAIVGLSALQSATTPDELDLMKEEERMTFRTAQQES